MFRSLKLGATLLVFILVATFGFQNCSQKPLELNNLNQTGTNTGGSGGGGDGGGGVSTGLNAGQANYLIEEGRTLDINLTLSSPAEGNYTVSWEILPIDAGLFAANDFDIVTGGFSILADQTGGSISLRAKENAVVSVDKKYRLRITFSGSDQPLVLYLTFKDNDSAQVFAGHVHTCLLKSGSLKCFGANNAGQLGNGNVINQSSPVPVSGMSVDVQKAAVGINNTCAIKSGQLYCWGNNSSGQLGKGDATTLPTSAPSLVPTMDSGVTDVVVGYYTICAIKNGAVFCWGDGRYGTVGDGTFTRRLVPTAVTGLSSGVSAIAMSDTDAQVTAGVPGVGHACAIKSGALYCWGYNPSGEIGDGTLTSKGVPTLASGMEADVSLVSAAQNSTCAVRKSNLYCWGANGQGQLGLGDVNTRYAPTLVSAFIGKKISQIDGDELHYCANADGKVYCWGDNAGSQIGTGNTVDAISPAQLAGLDVGISSIATSTYGSFAIQNNKLLGWGRNSEGQLGRGNVVTPQTAPQITFDLANF